MSFHSLLQGVLPDLGNEPRSPELQADSLLAEPPGKDGLGQIWEAIYIYNDDGRIQQKEIVMRVQIWKISSILISTSRVGAYLKPQNSTGK